MFYEFIFKMWPPVPCVPHVMSFCFSLHSRYFVAFIQDKWSVSGTLAKRLKLKLKIWRESRALGWALHVGRTLIKPVQSRVTEIWTWSWSERHFTARLGAKGRSCRDPVHRGAVFMLKEIWEWRHLVRWATRSHCCTGAPVNIMSPKDAWLFSIELRTF